MLRRITSSSPAVPQLSQIRGYAAATGKAKNVKKKDNFQKTRSLGFKLKKAAPAEKKKISGNALVKPFPNTVARAAKISLTSELPAISEDSLKSESAVMVSYQGDVSKTCAVGSAFSPKRGFELLGERSTLLRSESRELFSVLDNKSKIVLDGPINSGRRELLTQAMAYAKINNWVVLPVPQLLQYINGTSDYAITESGRLDLLRRNREFFKKLKTMNTSILKNIKLSKSYQFGSQIKLTEGENSLLDLVSKGIPARFQAGEIFEAVIAELANQKTHKVLLPVYDVDILARQTEYRTPEYKQISAKDLQIAQLIKNPPKNFVQIMTTSGGDETSVALGYKQAADFVYESRFDQSLVDHVKDAHVLKVSPVSADESSVLLNYYKSRGLALESEQKLHVVSGGLVGELWRQVRVY